MMNLSHACKKVLPLSPDKSTPCMEKRHPKIGYPVKSNCNRKKHHILKQVLLIRSLVATLPESLRSMPMTVKQLKWHDELGTAALLPVTAMILHLDKLSGGAKTASSDRPTRAFLGAYTPVKLVRNLLVTGLSSHR